MKYVIKSVPSDDTQALEDLLNEMSSAGWDLYSMHEVECEDDGFQFNCIFITDKVQIEEDDSEDIINVKSFKSQMEKMLSSSVSAYDSCKEIQGKIKECRKKINKIKTQLEAQSETPISRNRQELNDEMSRGLKTLDELRQTLVKTISPETMYSKIHQDKLSIHLSEEALDIVNPDMGGTLIAETVKVREDLTSELGYVLPKIIFADDDELNSYEFSINIRGLDCIKSCTYPNYLMFFESDLQLTKKIKGAIYTTDEISGRKIIWIEEKKAKAYWQYGLTAAEFVARLLKWVTIQNIDELLDYTDINRYIDIVSKENQFLIENIIPDFVSVAEVKYILSNLLREEISIKDIVFIFEKINDYADEAVKEDLLDKIRISMAKIISKKYSNEENSIQGFDLSEKTYNKLFKNVTSDDNIVRIDGDKVGKIAKSIVKKLKLHNLTLDNFVIFAPVEIRHMLFMILSQFIPSIKVIAKEEIANEYSIDILDEI